ncbi:ECs_2282 family putative zinc-binding protein [Rouxiella badensis]
MSRPDDFHFDTNFVDVFCGDCGREIFKDDVISQATNTVKKQIDDMFRNTFKGGGFKLK